MRRPGIRARGGVSSRLEVATEGSSLGKKSLEEAAWSCRIQSQVGGVGGEGVGARKGRSRAREQKQ